MRRLISIFFVCMCGFPVAVFAQPSVTQAPNTFAAGALATIPLTISSTAANSLLVACAGGRDSSTLTSFTDTNLDTFTLVTAVTMNGGLNFMRCGYVCGTGSGNTLVTGNYGGAPRDRFIFVWEVANVATSSCTDATPTRTTEGLSVNPSGPAITFTGTNSIVLGALMEENTISGGTAGGFTSDGINNTSAFNTFAYNHQVNTNTTLTPSWTSGNTHFGAVTFAFKAAGGGAAAAPNVLTLGFAGPGQ